MNIFLENDYILAIYLISHYWDYVGTRNLSLWKPRALYIGSQSYKYSWPGENNRQITSSLGVHLVNPEHSDSDTRRVENAICVQLTCSFLSVSLQNDRTEQVCIPLHKFYSNPWQTLWYTRINKFSDFDGNICHLKRWKQRRKPQISSRCMYTIHWLKHQYIVIITINIFYIKCIYIWMSL